MAWQHIDNQKRHTQDGCQLVRLMKKPTHRRKVLALDVGCGDGIIAFEILRLARATDVVAFDISKRAAQIAKINLESFKDRVHILHQSARQFFLKKSNWEKFDCFVINPPFFPSGSGMKNLRDWDQTARHEGSLNLKAWAQGARRLLRTGGELYCVFPSERLAECLSVLSQQKVEPKEIWWFKDDKKKRRFFLRAMRGAKKGMIVNVDFELERMIQGQYA